MRNRRSRTPALADVGSDERVTGVDAPMLGMEEWRNGGVEESRRAEINSTCVGAPDSLMEPSKQFR